MPPPTPSTASAPASIRGPLRVGSRSPDVRALQSALNGQPSTVPALEADGIFGLRTSQAVQRFQSARSLGVDGIVGPNTARMLGLAYTPAPVYTPPAPVVPGGGGGGASGGGGAGSVIPGGGTVPAGPPSLQTELAALMDAVARGISNVASAVISLVQSIEAIPDAIIDSVRSTISGLCAQAASNIRAAASFIGVTVQDLVGTVFARIRDVLGRFISNVAGFLGRFTGLPLIGGTIAEIIGSVRQVVEAVLSTILNWMQAGATQVATGIQRVLNLFAAGAGRILSLA